MALVVPINVLAARGEDNTMTLQHITLAETKAACRKAHAEGRLLAQAEWHSPYGYRIGTLVCAIGAVLDNETLDAMDNNPDIRHITLGTLPSKLSDYFTWDNEEYDDLSRLQTLHDKWLHHKGEEWLLATEQGESEFLDFIKE